LAAVPVLLHKGGQHPNLFQLLVLLPDAAEVQETPGVLAGGVVRLRRGLLPGQAPAALGRWRQHLAASGCRCKQRHEWRLAFVAVEVVGRALLTRGIGVGGRGAVGVVPASAAYAAPARLAGL
jgi:hypothetical protein